MKSLLLVLLIVSVSSVRARAQAITEYSLGAARGAVGGAGTGKATGKGAATVFEKAGKALDSAASASSGAGASSRPASAKTGSTQTASAKASAPPGAEQPAPAIALQDPGDITTGLDRQELLAKFAKPSMRLSSNEGSDLVEKYWYRSQGRETILVTLRNGKVASVSPPPSSANIEK